eukprot:SM000003S11152  [mRNA]  locus=s3:1227662:1229976:- [translate_table: standard]
MRPVMCSRIKSGFTLSVVDTPGLVEAGSVNDQSLDLIRRKATDPLTDRATTLFGVAEVDQLIDHDCPRAAAAARFLLDKRVDAILYVDRLDNYRVDNLDRQVFRAIARAFGPKVWRIASIVLTHAQLSPPDGVSYSDFVAKRTAALQQAVRQETGLRKGDRQVPTVLVENSGRCATNSGGEKILPDGTVWLPQMVEAVVDAATSGRPPLVVDQKLIDGPDANRRGKIWIPLLLAVQASSFSLYPPFFLVLKPILKLIEKDVAAEHAKRPTWELRAERALQKEAARAAEERRAELAEEALEREAAEAAAEAEELYGEDDEEYEDDEED